MEKLFGDLREKVKGFLTEYQEVRAGTYEPCRMIIDPAGGQYIYHHGDISYPYLSRQRAEERIREMQKTYPGTYSIVPVESEKLQKLKDNGATHILIIAPGNRVVKQPL
jgi:hypothetical protein